MASLKPLNLILHSARWVSQQCDKQKSAAKETHTECCCIQYMTRHEETCNFPNKALPSHQLWELDLVCQKSVVLTWAIHRGPHAPYHTQLSIALTAMQLHLLAGASHCAAKERSNAVGSDGRAVIGLAKGHHMCLRHGAL